MSRHLFGLYISLFNSCERLLLGTLILDQINRVKCHRHEQKSDLIQQVGRRGLVGIFVCFQRQGTWDRIPVKAKMKKKTLSNTKRGTDLGTLVIPFDQTFHPLHILLYFRVTWLQYCEYERNHINRSHYFPINYQT